MLRALSHPLHPPISPFTSLRPPRQFLSLSPISSSSSPSTLHSSTTTKMPLIPTVEHIVLFKVRDSTDPSNIQSMLSNLRRLSSLQIATQLTVSPILRSQSSAAAFTHLLYSRYRSKSDLSSYSNHPSHLSVVQNNVLPICDDILSVDWVVDVDVDVAPSPGSLVRVTLGRPREGIVGAEVVRAVDGIRASLPDSVKVSCGENFSPGRAKGYEVGFVSVFAGVDEVERIDGDEEVEKEMEKMRMLLESVIVVDFIVPTAVVSGL